MDFRLRRVVHLNSSASGRNSHHATAPASRDPFRFRSRRLLCCLALLACEHNASLTPFASYTNFDASPPPPPRTQIHVSLVLNVRINDIKELAVVINVTLRPSQRDWDRRSRKATGHQKRNGKGPQEIEKGEILQMVMVISARWGKHSILDF